jgi:GxxExxY protein
LNRQDAKTPRKKKRLEMPYDDELTPYNDSPEPSAEVDHLARAVIGALIEVHRVVGPEFLEQIYEQALAVELTLRNIRFEQQVPVSLVYKGVAIGESRLDFVVDGKLIVEIKACDCLAPIHKAQVISYLKATGHKLALLVNFNVPILKNGLRRIILS